MNSAAQIVFAGRPPVATMAAGEIILSQAEFAARVNVSRSAVCQAVAGGRFSEDGITPQGFLRWPRALQDWYDNADVRRHGPGKTNGIAAATLMSEGARPGSSEKSADPLPADPLPADPSPSPADYTPPVEGSLAFERLETSRLRRRTMELEIGIRENKYRPVAEIESAMMSLGRIVRRSLMQIPGWADDIAAAQADPAALKSALKQKARALCEEVARAMVDAAADGESAPADDDDSEHDES